VERPLRSWMFVPGNRQRFLDKIYETDEPPDAVFFDLEDGVIPAEKPLAREMVTAVLRKSQPGPLRAVRVNAPSTEWLAQDLDAILGSGLEGVCIAKVEDPEQVVAVAERLHGDTRIIVAIESARGLLRAHEIARSHERVLALMFGAEDYALDIGLGTKRAGAASDLIYARSALVNAAAAARVLSIDGVYPNLEDPEGLVADLVQSRELGFDGKSTFNPRQIGLIHDYYNPRPDELEYARRVADAFADATARGDASVAVGGQLVDLPIVQRAQRVLELAEQLAGARG
jgi:citrate lyase subunit beta / citryl-CoA lyase